MNSFLQNKSEEISKLCFQSKVKRLFAFGSVISDRFDAAKSDLDFLVEINRQADPLAQGENMLNLWNGLEKMFNKPVDLLTPDSLRNPVLKAEIERTKVLIYEA